MLSRYSPLRRVLALVSTLLFLPHGTLSAPTASPLPTKNISSRQTGYDPTACNNHPGLCATPYSSIYHLGTHDSPFLRNPSNGFSIAGNQYLNVHAQLSMGVRLLQGQIHFEPTQPTAGQIRLCHTDCRMMDGGTLADYLAAVKSWMDTHPSEVITMLWVNADNLPATTLAPIFEAAGMDASTVFTPAAGTTRTTAWPTLREMITSNKRLVIFLSTKADPAAVPWLLNEFTYLFETDFENFDQPNKPSSPSPSPFDCNAHRPRQISDPLELAALAETKMGLMNRFLYQAVFEQFGVELFIPDPGRAKEINGGDAQVKGNLGSGLTECTAAWGGRRGGFVLVDFFNEGGAVGVIDSANGLGGAKMVNRWEGEMVPKRNEDGEFEPVEFTKATDSAGEMCRLFDIVHGVFEPGEKIEVIDDVVDTGEEVVEGGKVIVEEGKDIVKDVVEEGKDIVEDVVEEGKEVVEEGKDVVKDVLEDIGDFFPFSISSSRIPAGKVLRKAKAKLRARTRSARRVNA